MFPTSQRRAADPSGRIPHTGGCSGRSAPELQRQLRQIAVELKQTGEAAKRFRPQLKPGTRLIREWQGRPTKSWSSMTASPGRARNTARCRDRAKDHRHGVVGTALLRLETKPIGKPPVIASIGSSPRGDGGQPCRGVTRAASAALSTPANPPRKGSSRNSTRSRRRAKPARPTSAANVTRVGYWPGPLRRWRVLGWQHGPAGAAAPARRHPGSRIDIIVVYKVDRLTRSLADFARLVEIFDAQEASFVSVTQQFNTTSSMGRLTLNVLLSFAQFERRSPANGSVTRSPPRKRRACGWAAMCRSAMTPPTAPSSSTLPRPRRYAISSHFIVTSAACAGSRRRPIASAS